MTFEKWYKRETDDNENNIDDWKGFCKSAFEAGKGDIADLKANFDYVLEGKDLEIKQLGERCNQLLKDKGNLTDQIADIKANCDLAIEGRDIKIKELELELTEQKDQLQEEINLHLHAEEYIKSLEQQIEQMKCDVKQEQSHWNSCEMQYDLYQRLLDKWEIK